MTEKDNEFINYANSFQAVARLELESITALMNEFKNPQDRLKFIHVAGTNGKGSVCAFLQCILTDAGYKTGKFISPNMLRVNERITVDGEEIGDDDLNKLLLEVEKKAKIVEKKTGSMPTQFEIWTAAAFLWYDRTNCDYVVLETGLGGVRDATNIIKNPVATIITRIAKDHTNFLGNTLPEIAEQKAGIIKKSGFGGISVTLPQDEAVIKVLSDKAKEKNNRFIITKQPILHSYNNECEIFDYGEIKNIGMTMSGVHQTENAALAIETAMLLGIKEKYILSGIKRAKNIGRLEILSEKPLILFDGAHNKNGMDSLKKAIIRYYPDKKLNFIIGFMQDKDIISAICELKDICSEDTVFYTVTVEDNPRAESAQNLANILIANGYNAKPCQNIKEAYEKIKMSDRLNVICGSLYLYKDLMNNAEIAMQNTEF